MNFYPPQKLYFLQNLFNLPEYKDRSLNIKFDYCKCTRIYEKVHLRSDFRKKNTFLAWAPTHKNITLVNGKNSKCTSLIMNTL